MPRKRMIKPEFWTDEKILELDPIARLLFIGIWNFADDEGIIQDSVKGLKVKIFPADDIKVELIEDYLNSIVELKLILKGSDEKGHNLLKVANWHNHQKINHPTPTQYIFIEDKEDISVITKLGVKDESLINSIDKNSIRPNPEKKATPKKDTSEFDHFYSLYPRKIKKKNAETAFNRLSSPDKEKALVGLASYITFWDSSKIEKEFIPHPSSWLNSRQWEDDIPSISKDPKFKSDLDKEIFDRNNNLATQSSRLREYLKESEGKAEDIPDLTIGLTTNRGRSNEAQSIKDIIRPLTPKPEDTTTPNG